MFIKKHPRLILLLTALIVVVCRCDGSKVVLQTKDGQDLQCQYYIEESGSIRSGVECKIACEGFALPISFDMDGVDEVTGTNYADLYLKYCNEPLPTEAPDVTPDEAFTEEETQSPPTDPPAESSPLQPYLTGAATACDLTQRYINFIIDPAAEKTNPAGLEVAFDDVPVNCTVVPTSGDTILACSFHADTLPPFFVTVRIEGEEVNEFIFDGGICTTSQPPKPKETEAPISTEPPAECPPELNGDC